MARMLDIREKTRLRRFMYAKPTIILLAILVGLIIHGVWGIYEKKQDAITKRDKAISDLSNSMKRENDLNQNIHRLTSERGVEAEIRDRFMVAKEGEKVMIIASPTVETSHSVTVEEQTPSLVHKMMSAVGISN